MSKQVDPHHKADSPSVAEAMMQFLVRFRTALIIIGITIAVAVIAGFTIQYLRQARAEASAETVATLNQSYQQWMQATENDEDAAIYREQFMDAYSEARDSYGSMYAGELAQFLYAQIAFAEQDYTAAAELFSELAQDSQTHLAALSAMNAAVAFEADADTSSALAAYAEAAERFSDSSPEAPRALFAIGRLSETQDIQTAIDTYEDVIDIFPNSDWAKLAESRIIFLRSVD